MHMPTLTLQSHHLDHEKPGCYLLPTALSPGGCLCSICCQISPKSSSQGRLMRCLSSISDIWNVKLAGNQKFSDDDQPHVPCLHHRASAWSSDILIFQLCDYLQIGSRTTWIRICTTIGTFSWVVYLCVCRTKVKGLFNFFHGGPHLWIMKQLHAWFGLSKYLIVWVISLTQTIGGCNMVPSNDTLDEKRLHTHTVKNNVFFYIKEKMKLGMGLWKQENLREWPSLLCWDLELGSWRSEYPKKNWALEWTGSHRSGLPSTNPFYLTQLSNSAHLSIETKYKIIWTDISLYTCKVAPNWGPNGALTTKPSVVTTYVTN